MASDPRTIRRDALERLLAPMDRDEFVANHWDATSVLVGGHPGKLAGLFDEDRFFRAIEAAEAIGARALGFSIAADVDRQVHASEVRAALDAGQTVCVAAIDTGDPALAEFAAEIKAQLSFPGRVAVHAYLSPPGTGYSFLHFDARIATTVQISGRKRWRYADRPTVRWPVHNGRIEDESITWQHPPTPWEQPATWEARELSEATLEPGDLLCIPAGTVHCAEAAEERSLSLNFSFNYRGFQRIVSEHLFALLAADPAWRTPPPPRSSLDRAQGVAAGASVEFIQNRLDDMRTAIESLAANATLVPTILWQHASTAPAIRLEGEAAIRDVKPDDLVRVPVATYLVADAEASQSFLITAAEPLAIGGEAIIAFLAKLVEHRQFVAKDALGWGARPFRWESLQPILTDLVRRGALVIAA